MSLEYGRFDLKFQEEREKSIKFEKEVTILREEHEKLKKLSHRQRLEIIDYEQRYMGIDITKLHEQVEFLKSQVIAAQVGEKSFEKDLYEFRAKIFDILFEMDQNVGGSGLDMKELKSRRKLAWKGASEIEEVCGLFTVFLTTPTA